MNAGLGYENKVRSVVRAASRVVPHLSVSSIGGKTQSDIPDVTIISGGDRIPIEVKLDARAQMGNPLNVLYSDQQFSVKQDESVDRAVENVILRELEKKKADFDRLIDFISSFPPSYNYGAASIPISCSKKAWDAAVAKGLIRSLNTTVRVNSSVITDYYAKKGTNYMQIGGQGLFHMGKNPLDFPVPKLIGEVNIELRLAHHGAKPHKEVKERVTGDLRAIARLLTREKSPWTLDDRDHILMLFGPGKKRKH